jgi:hypothetical protein
MNTNDPSNPFRELPGRALELSQTRLPALWGCPDPIGGQGYIIFN